MQDSKWTPCTVEGRIHSIFQQCHTYSLSTYHSPVPLRISQFSTGRHLANRSLQHDVVRATLWVLMGFCGSQEEGQQDSPGASAEDTWEELVMLELTVEGEKGVNSGRQNGRTFLSA